MKSLAGRCALWWWAVCRVQVVLGLGQEGVQGVHVRAVVVGMTGVSRHRC